MSQLQQIHARAANEKGEVLRLATGFTLVAVLTLIAVKAAAWWMTDSLSLLSSLADSGMDLLASLLNFLAVRYSLQPPDHEHRFGHGKVEYISGLCQAAFISATAIFIGIGAVQRFFSPVEVQQSGVGIGVMVFSIVVTVGIVSYQRHAVRKTGSTAVKADSVHYLSDVLSNVAVIAALVLVEYTGWAWIDPLFALAIAGYILFGAREVGYAAFQHLMDREFSDEERGAIYEVARAIPGVKHAHNLKTRRSGLIAFIQLTVDIDGGMPLKEAHDINDLVEDAVQALHPDAEVHIHTEPV